MHNNRDPEFFLSSISPKRSNGHHGFRIVWWLANCLLFAALVNVICSAAWEYSVRRYLKGFSDAIVPAASTPEQKVEAILTWMRSGPPRPLAAKLDQLDTRDPEITLNYRQLLQVCGSATNAFLNLSRSAGLSARRLLLLGPDRKAKHVVAEVLLEGRWVVVDPTYRVMMRSADGRRLTRQELRDPATFAEATSVIPDYPQYYTYESVVHVRISRLPLQGLGIRKFLNLVIPGWDEGADWSLLLERQSFFVLCASISIAAILLVIRVLLAWHADRRLGIARFHFRQHMLQAGAAFLSAPEMKQ